MIVKVLIQSVGVDTFQLERIPSQGSLLTVYCTCKKCKGKEYRFLVLGMLKRRFWQRKLLLLQPIGDKEKGLQL